ncbi:MAG: hypothetical protein JW748_09760 [Anaerolineales bacterium]|nr:hypothetical protein [Anaerolineales bacterium]
MNKQRSENGNPGLSQIFRLGGVAALGLIVYSIITMICMVVFGGQPKSAEEAFTLLQNNKLIGLLRLDILTVAGMIMYYPLYAGMSAALWEADRHRAGLAAALAFIGVTLLLATPSAASMVYLGDRYAAATESQKTLYLAAGESVIAADMWHGTGALVGGLFIPCAGVLISAALLRRKIFGKWTSIAGILTNSLDLIRMLIGFFSPGAAFAVMAIAGPLYLVWFPLVGRRLLQLGREKGETD